MARPLILLADDDRDTVEAYEALFRSCGYSTGTAADGPSALAAVLELRPDVVVLDVGLPRLDGLTVLRRLRADAACAQTPVVVVTGHGSTGDAEAVRRQGADAVLIKPCEADDLRATVERLLERVPPRD